MDRRSDGWTSGEGQQSHQKLDSQNAIKDNVFQIWRCWTSRRASEVVSEELKEGSWVEPLKALKNSMTDHKACPCAA